MFQLRRVSIIWVYLLVLAFTESHDAEQNLVGRMKFSTPDGKLVQFYLKLGFFASVAFGLVDYNEILN